MINPLRPDGAIRLWVIMLLAALFWGAEYWQRDLWEPDEARFAYVAREMRQDGHWLVPYRSGEFYAHKPPLMFWLINAVSTLNGGEINRITTRLPTLAGTILSLWTTGRIAAVLFGGAAGWMAPMLLAVTALFWKVNGMGQIDGLLCGLEMLAFWLLFSTPEPKGRGQFRVAAAYLIMGLAILAKGPVGLLVPLGAWVAFTAFSGEPRRLRRAHLLWGPPLALLPVALWLGAIVYFKAAPEGFFDELLFKQNVGRVTGEFASGHNKPVWYFAQYFIIDFLPWTLLLPAAVLALKKTPADRKAVKSVTAWLLFVILFFSLSSTKRNLYTLMAYPAAAMLLAAGWDRIAAAPARFRLGSQRFLAGLFLLAGLAMTLAAPVIYLFKVAVPVETGWLIPGGLVLAVTGVLLLRKASLADAGGRRWLVTAWGGMALTLWLTAALFYPAMNPLKAPYALAEAAQIYLPKGQDLLIYRINGEIQALYCNARGRSCDDVGQLAEAIAEQKRGLIVMHDKQWADIGDLPELAGAIRGTYKMGSKTLIWAAFDLKEQEQGSN